MAGNLWRNAAGGWLRNAAEEQLAQLAAAARGEEQDPGEQSERGFPPDRPSKVSVAVVFGNASEAGGLEDLLKEKVYASSGELQLRLGKIDRIPVVAAWAGQSESQLRRATEAVLLGHKPQWVVAAGFSTALSEEPALCDLIVADTLLTTDGESIELLPALDTAACTEVGPIRTGPLLSVDRPVLGAERKKALAGEYRALASDPAGRVVCEVCRRSGTPVLVVRIVAETLAERPPAEVRSVEKQQSFAGRLGAMLGAAWRRPSSLKDLWQRKERALVASDRLGRFLAVVVEQLGRSGETPQNGSGDDCNGRTGETSERSP